MNAGSGPENPFGVQQADAIADAAHLTPNQAESVSEKSCAPKVYPKVNL